MYHYQRRQVIVTAIRRRSGMLVSLAASIYCVAMVIAHLSRESTTDWQLAVSVILVAGAVGVFLFLQPRERFIKRAHLSSSILFATQAFLIPFLVSWVGQGLLVTLGNEIAHVSSLTLGLCCFVGGLLEVVIGLMGAPLRLVVFGSELQESATREIVQQSARGRRYLVLDNPFNKVQVDGVRRLPEVDVIVVEPSYRSSLTSTQVLMAAKQASIPIVSVDTLRLHLSGRIVPEKDPTLTFLGEGRCVAVLRSLGHLAHNVAERVFAAFLGVVFLPIGLLLVALIRLESPGPALFWQRRVGYCGRPFWMVKFRSMHLDSERFGPQWASDVDDRVTRVGRFLRNSRLDELPQLWNVLRGEMSFVGPRPERPEISEQLAQKIPFFFLRTLVRPGITGWAQVCSGYAASVEESRLKLEYDLYYIRHKSWGFDLEILINTVETVLWGREFIPAQVAEESAEAAVATESLEEFKDESIRKAA